MGRSKATKQLGSLAAQGFDGDPSAMIARISGALAREPGRLVRVADELVEESRKKKPDDDVMAGLLEIIGGGLQSLRLDAEQGLEPARQTIGALRSRLVALVRQSKIAPGLLLMLLQKFIAAKIDPGAELRELMASLAASAGSSQGDLLDTNAHGARFADHLSEFGGDLFAFQADLSEMSGVFPENGQIGLVAALLDAPAAEVREAAVGWLLDSAAEVRSATSSMIESAASGGRVSGTMLRRMIMLRNWLPDGERATLDAAIRACRQAGIDRAPLPETQVIATVASPFDGSGAQSIFCVVRQGRKHAVASVLVRHGFGVRDAWVRRGLSKADLDDFMSTVAMQVSLSGSTLDYLQTALTHFLAVNGVCGVLPPFGLADVVETIGLAGLNPELLATDRMIGQLFDAIDPDFRTPAAVAQAVRASRTWPDDYPVLETWFEDATVVNAQDGRSKLSVKSQRESILNDVLPLRREYWTQMLAWTALWLRHDDPDGDWEAFALVALELLNGRPVGEIPLMRRVASLTAEALRERAA